MDKEKAKIELEEIISIIDKFFKNSHKRKTYGEFYDEIIEKSDQYIRYFFPKELIDFRKKTRFLSKYEIYQTDYLKMLKKLLKVLNSYQYTLDLISSVKDVDLINSNKQLMQLFNRFNWVVKVLRDKPDKRANIKEPIVVDNEYDMQYLMRGLLFVFFNNVEFEVYGEPTAGISPRVDFRLNDEKIILEVKRIRDKDHAKKITKEIIQDKEIYSKFDVDSLYFFIYDPDGGVTNRESIIQDLEANKFNYKTLKIVFKPDL